MKQALIIDRFEGDYAVCEHPDRTMENILRSKLPGGAQEGDAIRLIRGKYAIDKTETEKLKKHIEQLMNDVWKK
jgi:hypothetical protein